ncbi:NAD(P)-binding protein [Dongia deserti]|uniref:NAD(P)-binding protein n=1 Tax=Dongia deserti TaxID=2268030 RepID=UPI000E65A206|nr:NAD(P)-binding protein [Dongia deserti]
MSIMDQLPVAIIGGGPIGLAAAAHLAERGMPFKLYEAGETVGANIRDWSHCRIFTPWEFATDTASCRLLAEHGWRAPPSDVLPTGDDIYRLYLKPLARVPELAPHIETGAKVEAITRLGIDKVASKGRESRPFRLTVARMGEAPRYDLARAVIDASGTWQHQNPLGASGLPADGEAEFAERIFYGMPDVLGRERANYAGRRIAVAGGGFSAINVLLDLVQLADQQPQTEITWIVRATRMHKIYGGGENDQLPARGALGMRLRELVDGGRVKLIQGFATSEVRRAPGGVVLLGQTPNGPVTTDPMDRIVVATGQRPDLGLTRELRLELDPWLESVKALGPLIDPNLHSCGSVPPHGHRETGHPEPGFYTIGVKSYGRAPTFLLLTGYEQARSVAAALAGDMEAADAVHLTLPETGICETDPIEDGAGCCGGPAPVEIAAQLDACCIKDAVAKQAGKQGCGCS